MFMFINVERERSKKGKQKKGVVSTSLRRYSICTRPSKDQGLTSVPTELGDNGRDTLRFWVGFY